jgi:hypothetical protein
MYKNEDEVISKIDFAKTHYPNFCFSACPKGLPMQRIFAEENESVIDAAHDFQDYVDYCWESCKYRQEVLKEYDEYDLK